MYNKSYHSRITLYQTKLSQDSLELYRGRVDNYRKFLQIIYYSYLSEFSASMNRQNNVNEFRKYKL